MSLGSHGFGRDVPRHWLVRVTPDAWAEELAARANLADEPLLRDWATRCWPLVVRRRTARDRADRVPLGLPLPPSHGKRRVAAAVSPDAIVAMRPALALAEVRGSAPEVWRPTIDALLELGRDLHVEARVFGSFAWAAVTGLDYVTAASDLDLLWPLTDRLEALLARLAAIEAAAPGRLDGEIVAGGDAAVNWRELASGAADLLVKASDGVSLMPRRALLRTRRELA